MKQVVNYENMAQKTFEMQSAFMQQIFVSNSPDLSAFIAPHVYEQRALQVLTEGLHTFDLEKKDNLPKLSLLHSLLVLKEQAI